MEHLRKDWSDFLEYAKGFIKEPLTTLDIGCSGGIDEILKNFDNKIIYYGFDPNIAEITRLKKENKNPNIHYIEGFVDCEEDNAQPQNFTEFFEDTSAAEGAKILSNKIKDSHELMVSNNLWNNMKLTNNKIKIIDFIKEKNLPYADFIKSDIDGLDLSFFRQISPIISQIHTLSIVAEVCFASNNNDQADLTNLLKQNKFALYSLSTRSYSSKYLPDLFALNISAQAISGRLTQGDALYFQDEKCLHNYSAQQLLKLAILMDLFNLPDCAAKVICTNSEKLKESGINIDRALNLLTKQRNFIEASDYKDLITKFSEENEKFYPKHYTPEQLVKSLQEKISEIGEGSFYKFISQSLNNINSQRNIINQNCSTLHGIFNRLKNKFSK